MYLKLILILCVVIIPNTILKAQTKNEFGKGKIISTVFCLDDKSESYALYLPKDYDVSKKWPIIIGFSPMARGIDPVTLCLEAAEKFGFIVVGSNTIQNGPVEPIRKGYYAIKKDTEKRFSLDPQRIYSIGMSGASRVALQAATMDHYCGVIACAAFIDPAASYKNKDIFIYGIVGDQDPNYPEFQRGASLLNKSKTPYWIEIFLGGHQWPAKERVFEAIEMFDYLYQKTKVDKGLVQAELIINNRITNIEKMISQKFWVSASTEIDNLLRHFEKNSLIVKVIALRKRLDTSPEYVATKK